MKLSNLLKRTGAFVLSIALTGALCDGFLGEPLQAAGTNKIEFKEIIWDNEYIYTDNTAVVSGYGVGTRIQMDNSWKYTTPPFGYSWKGIPPGTTSQNLTGEQGSGYISLKHPMDIEPGWPDDTEWIQYEVNPRLSVNVKDGFGTFTYGRVVDSGPSQPTTVSVTVKSPSALPVTSNCSLTFRTENGQVDAEGAQSLSFEPVTRATGSWASSYVGATVTTKSVKDKEFTIEVRPQSGGDPTENKMEFIVSSPMNKVPAGAVFTLNYTYDALNGLALTATSPKRTMLNIKSDMRNLVGASETGKKLPYLEFNNKSDTQNMVTGSFKLLNTFYKYNAKMKIDWSVKDGGGTYVDIQQQRGSQQVTAVLQNIPPDDVDVTLVATIGFYEGAGTGITPITHEVPLTLLGTGTRPNVTLVQQTFGRNQGGAQQTETKMIVDNIFPTRMEVYDGSTTHVAPLNTQKTWPPFSVDANLKFGYARGRANYVKISASGSGKIEFREGGSPNGKVLDANGVTIQNNSTGSLQQITQGTFIGKQAGAVSLKIEYFNAAGAIAPSYSYNVQVEDHSPKSDASLKQLDARLTIDPNATDDQKEAFNATYSPNGALNYGFQSDMFTYNFSVPDVVETISLRPVYNTLSVYPGVDQSVSVSVTPPGASIPNVPNNTYSDAIPLVRDGTTSITLRASAEDGTLASYTLNILRSSQSIDNSLKDIVVNQINPEKTNVPLTPNFNPGVYGYTITVPYSVEKLNVKAIANDVWAAKPKITSDGPETNFFMRIFENASNKEVLLRYDVIDQATQQVNNVTKVEVTVTPENQAVSPQVYTILITRSPPDNNSDISSLKLFRNREGEEVKLDGKGFDKNQRIFYATVPYSTDQLRLELLPDSKLAQSVRVEASTGEKKTLQYVKKDTPLIFNFPGLGQGTTPDPALNEITYRIWTLAESGNETDPPYQLIVTRAPPDKDTGLTALTVQNEADNQAVPGYTFIPTKREYSFSVDYTVEAVVVTPTAKSKLSKVYVDGKLVNENVPSRTIKLAAGGVTKITVRIVPESGEADAGTYVLNITRTTPSNEARLINLVVNGGTDQKPTPFVPATTSYSWSIPEGTKDYTVTATSVDPKATITVNGKAAPNGGPSEKIVSTEATSTVTVVVTAEDGKTTKTYTLKISNYNLMKKSNNADLASLKLNHGQLAPVFNPSVLEYEVYVKPTAMSLALTPRPANSKAKVEVKHGNRVLSEFDGAYTSSLLEDETVFTILVTAEDGKATKTYILNVYRNDEEKEGVFAPITPDMVDFETANPIIIDIATYPVVDAQVFNTLKTEYPDKTILFKGNDYTLELKGSDMDTLVPHTATFDLSFSFTTPEETAIENLLYDMESRNDRIDPVYVYFDHHGTLPAPMLLTVSLGKEYSNETIYWNYYNKERDRIDYYGYVNTNAKGTFSVPIEHFSTYFITIVRVYGAENKSGLDFSSTPWAEEIGVETPTQKVNPNTGRADATPPGAGGTR